MIGGFYALHNLFLVACKWDLINPPHSSFGLTYIFAVSVFVAQQLPQSICSVVTVVPKSISCHREHTAWGSIIDSGMLKKAKLFSLQIVINTFREILSYFILAYFYVCIFTNMIAKGYFLLWDSLMKDAIDVWNTYIKYCAIDLLLLLCGTEIKTACIQQGSYAHA